MSNCSQSAVQSSDILLVLRSDGSLLPVYESALTIAEGWPWNIKRAYTNALLIRGTGTFEKVNQVSIAGPYGASLLSKVFSVLNSNWSISLQMTKAEESPKDIVNAVLHGLQMDQSTRRNLFDKTEGLPSGATKGGLAIEEIFGFLHLDDPDFVACDSL